jgi:hypothetical protein
MEYPYNFTSSERKIQIVDSLKEIAPIKVLDGHSLLKISPYIVNISSSNVQKVEWFCRLLPVLTSGSLNYCALQISDSISKILYFKSSKLTYLLPYMH